VVAEAEKHAAAAAGGWNDAGHHDKYPTCDVVVAESEALLGWVNLKLRGAIWPSLAAFGVDADDLWLQARTRTACAPHAHRVCMARAWHVHVHSTCTAGALRVHGICAACTDGMCTAYEHACHSHAHNRTPSSCGTMPWGRTGWRRTRTTVNSPSTCCSLTPPTLAAAARASRRQARRE